MAKKWFVFIPRTRTQADTADKANVGKTLLGTAKQWVTAKSTKFTTEGIICCGPGQQEVFPAGIDVDMSECTVYILGGHCTPGSDTLKFASVDITFDDIVARLIAAGLPKSFVGKIKVYSCNSGTGLSIDSVSFAAKFAGKMRELGWAEKARYYGYVGLVSMSYENTNTETMKLVDKSRFREIMETHCKQVDGFHKFVTGAGGGPAKYIGRASEQGNRVTV